MDTNDGPDETDILTRKIDGYIITIDALRATLAAALVKTQGANRFSAHTLTNSSGFAGQDGVVRFRPDGTNERALAVLQVNNRTAQVISPAPRSFG